MASDDEIHGNTNPGPAMWRRWAAGYAQKVAARSSITPKPRQQDPYNTSFMNEILRPRSTSRRPDEEDSVAPAETSIHLTAVDDIKQAHTTCNTPEQHSSQFVLSPDDPRWTAPLPMIHACDMKLQHFTHDGDKFLPFNVQRQSRIPAVDDPTLESHTGFIHPEEPIYKYGGPVFRVKHPAWGSMDVMLCSSKTCYVCNDELPVDSAAPSIETSPTREMPWVHTMRDCRPAETDGTLQFWQYGAYGYHQDPIPTCIEAKVRFTGVGVLGTRDAMACVPETCNICKHLIGLVRVENDDGSQVDWMTEGWGDHEVWPCFEGRDVAGFNLFRYA